jgi:hypothetical protein
VQAVTPRAHGFGVREPRNNRPAQLKVFLETLLSHWLDASGLLVRLTGDGARDPALAAVIASWPSLPESARRAILAIVEQVR